MKIGFNLDAISNLGKYSLMETPKAILSSTNKITFSEELKNIISKLKDENHEIYIFSPLSIDLDQTQKSKIKQKIINRFNKIGMPFNKFAFIKKAEFIDAIRRNYIDISIDNDSKNVAEIREFSDAIEFSDGKNYDDMLNEILECIDKNRQPVMDFDILPSNLPSEDKLWLKKYRRGDYKWLNNAMSPYDRLVSSNKDFQDEIAMEYFGVTFTYEELKNKIDEMCNKMMALGIKKGARVPIVLANTPESIITLYALFKAKATIAPIFPLSTVEDFKSKIGDIINANNKDGVAENYIFMSDIVYGRLKNIIPDNTKVIVLPVSNSMPKYMQLIFEKILKPKLKIQKVTYDDTFIHLNEFMSCNDYIGEIDTKFDNSFAAVQLFTGGTIKSKGVLLSQNNLDYSAKQFYNDRFDFKRGDKIAAFLPLNHSFGLIIGTHVAVTLGVNLDLIMKIDFKRLDKLFINDKVNLFGGIPNMFPAILNNPRFKGADLSYVKYILSGGSPLDKTERKSIDEFFKEHNSKAEIHDGYGLTETAGGCIYDGVPNMNMCVKIVEPGTQIELSYNQIGELCLSGPQIMMGYANSCYNEGKLQTHKDGNIWFHTGDTAFINDDGLVNIIGRLDRMIKVNGEQVLLDKIEEKINKLQFVEKCIVVKKDDEIRGTIPVAFIKLKPQYTWNDEIEKILYDFYSVEFDKYSIPRLTNPIEEFPVTNAGKIDFKALEKTLEQQKVMKKLLF